MRFAKVTYRAPGVQQLVTKVVKNPLKVNAQTTFWEVVYDNQQTFMIPAHNLVNVETYDEEESSPETPEEEVSEAQDD